MISTSLKTRTTCRVCGNPHLAPILALGDQHIAGVFGEAGAGNPIERTVPMDLVRCDMTRDEDACGLVQLRHTVPPSVLYRSYWYRSSVNRTMTDNLHGIASTAEEMVGLKRGDLVVDIGCNDGTLLDGYQTRDLRTVGFDPSDVARHAEGRGHEIVRDFYSYSALSDRLPLSKQKAKIITSIAMLYDLDDPAAFVAEVAEALAADGVWVMEMHYLPAMLETKGFDALVHEHLVYYSLAVLERLLDQAGLRALRAELNGMNGGSIRLFAGRRAVAPEDAYGLQEIRFREFELKLDAPDPYDEFRANTERVRVDLRDLCRRLTAEGKTIHAYGASTKGNTILQYAGLSREVIQCAADRNPAKWGSETIGTHIPIVSEEESRAMRPDYYLALPWHFLDEFVDREREFLARGGQFITPLPEVRVVAPELAVPEQERMVA